MRQLLTGSLILMAAAVLLATGCGRMALAPAGKTGESSSKQLRRPMMTQSGDSPWESHRALRRDSPRFASTRGGTVSVLSGDVAEVVVTAERPAWLMPEVVASASMMPEVVVHASWAPAALSALPSSDFVN